MKKLSYILILCNLLLLSSEQNRKYTKNTCNRTYYGHPLFTDAERQVCSECTLDRFEVYDNAAGKYVAHIAYKSSRCDIIWLRVDERYKNKGIGTELVDRAIEDMRTNHNCREISLMSARNAEKFWEKLGAKPMGDARYVFFDSRANSHGSSFDDSINTSQK